MRGGILALRGVEWRPPSPPACGRSVLPAESWAAESAPDVSKRPLEAESLQIESDLFRPSCLCGGFHAPAARDLHLLSGINWGGKTQAARRRDPCRRTETRVGLAESLGWSPETITALLIGYIPIQNKKCNKKNLNTSESLLLEKSTTQDDLMDVYKPWGQENIDAPLN